MAASTSMASSPSRKTRMPLFKTAAAGLKFDAVGSGTPPEVSACQTMTKATREAARIKPTAHGLVTLRQPTRCNMKPPQNPPNPSTEAGTTPQLDVLSRTRVNDNDSHQRLV